MGVGETDLKIFILKDVAQMAAALDHRLIARRRDHARRHIIITTIRLRLNYTLIKASGFRRDAP